MSGKKVVIVCDDNFDILGLVSHVIQSAGYEVKRASSHKDVLQILDTCTPDLLVSDIRMPGRDGFWIAEYLQSVNLSIPIVFMTAYDSGLYRTYAPFVGAVEFLTKPIDVGELLRKVVAALEKNPVSRSAEHRTDVEVIGVPDTTKPDVTS